MFRGSSNHTIDGKGRIIIPSRFREQFGSNNGDAVALMVTRLDNCLFAYSLKDWMKIEDRIVSISETSDKMRAFRRFFIGGAYECFCDKQGRVLIPPTLREYAALERDIVLVGALEYFEIWSQERWKRQTRKWEVLSRMRACVMTSRNWGYKRMAFRHVSAMLSEAVSALNCRPGGTYVDCTLGGGGHARAIWEKISPNGRLIGIDQDRAAIENAAKLFGPSGRAHVHLFHGNFIQLPEYLCRSSTLQPWTAFCSIWVYPNINWRPAAADSLFRRTNPWICAWMSVGKNRLKMWSINIRKKLCTAFSKSMEKSVGPNESPGPLSSNAGRRQFGPQAQLTAVIRGAVPGVAAKQKIHPATRVFMALRIAVNEELASLDKFLDFALDLLSDQGRLCILSFHSLEDRLVKQRFKTWSKACTCPPEWPQCMCSGRPKGILITKKVMRPSALELAQNPMARSTRLRAVEKLPAV